MDTISVRFGAITYRFFIRWILVVVSIISLLFWAVLLVSRPLFADFPIANVGGTVLTAPEIDGTNFSFSSSSTQTEFQQSWPSANMKTDTMQFPYGVTITKTLDFSATPIAAYGIQKVQLKFTINQSEIANNASFQLSGIQSNEVNFTTGYDDQGNPVLNTPDGIQPISVLNDNYYQVTQLTNASLNTHSFVMSDFNWSQATIQVIPVDANGNPVTTTNGTFPYDATYENQKITP